MDKLHIEIIQPDKIKLSGDYDHIIVPGVDGDLGIMLDHTPFITKIRPGVLKVYQGNTIDFFAIHDGFVTVENNNISIVCDVIEKDSEIDKSRAEAAKSRAEQRMKAREEDIDLRRAEYALKRALVRLSI